MALDTAAKRRAAAVVGLVFMAAGVTPDATPDQAWRQAGGWSYLGILAGEGPSESLGTGDLTTEFSYWLRDVQPDVTTNIRDRLAAHYDVDSTIVPADNATLVSRFLQNRQ